MKIFKLGELFAGAGGLAWGALHAEHCDSKIIHAWANDCDASTCDTYRENICPDAVDSVICCDVRDLNFDTLGAIDALAFGFPCNDFSVIGKRAGLNGKYGLLYKYAVKALEKFQPAWFVAENVRGLTGANKGSAQRQILNSFKNAGYKIFPHLYKFESYGVPQTRHRIIIVGIRNDIEKVFRPPAPLIGKNISSRNALENPPILPDVANNEKTRQSPKVDGGDIIKKARTRNLPHTSFFIGKCDFGELFLLILPLKECYCARDESFGGSLSKRLSYP